MLMYFREKIGIQLGTGGKFGGLKNQQSPPVMVLALDFISTRAGAPGRSLHCNGVLPTVL
jgi:hypothetical protein